MNARETIAAPRADWLLLRMHYLRVVIPAAIVCFGVELALMIVVAIASTSSTMIGASDQGLDLTAVVLSLFIALPVGAAVFSRAFKEQHVLVFHALPVSRLRQWSLFAAASLLALVTIYAGFAILRPGAASLIVQSRMPGAFVLAVAISFAAGLCFALVSVRTVSVYMTAYCAALLAPLLVGLGLVAPYLAIEPPGPNRSTNELLAVIGSRAAGLPAPVPWIAGALVVALYCAASALFYVRGEMTLTRVQLRNAALAFGAVLLVALVTTPLLYLAAGGPWQTTPYRLSPDGRFVAVWRYRENAPWKGDVRVHDLASGTSRAVRIDGLRGVEWTEKNELMTIVRDVSPLKRLWYLLPPHDRVIRWSARGERLGELRFDGVIRDDRRLDRAHHLAVVWDRATTRLIAIEHGATAKTLLEQPTASRVQLGDGLLFLVYADKDPRVWRVTPQRAQELTRIPGATAFPTAWVQGAVFYPDRDALLRKIEATSPAPREAGERVGYVFPEDARWFYAVVARPGTDGKLFVTDAAKPEWRLITDKLPLGPAEIPRVAASFYDLNTAASTAIGPTLALFAERAGTGIAYRLFDPSLGATATLFERDASDRRAFDMSARRVETLDAVRVTVNADQQVVREWLWRNGRLTPIEVRPGGILITIWPDGTQVRGAGTTVTLAGANGAVRRVALVDTDARK